MAALSAAAQGHEALHPPLHEPIDATLAHAVQSFVAHCVTHALSIGNIVNAAATDIRTRSGLSEEQATAAADQLMAHFVTPVAARGARLTDATEVHPAAVQACKVAVARARAMMLAGAAAPDVSSDAATLAQRLQEVRPRACVAGDAAYAQRIRNAVATVHP